VTNDAARTRMAERLAALRLADDRLDGTLEGITAGSGIANAAIDSAPLEVIAAARAALRAPLSSELAAPEFAQSASSRQDDNIDGDDSIRSSIAEAVQAAYVALGRASGAAAALFTFGRLMDQDPACDLASTRLKMYAQLARALNALLPQVVGWELREDGLWCLCNCPMCAIGACSCIWASMHSIDVALGGPGLTGPDELGIPLRSPPRPGSDFEVAGIQQWDRVLSVDGEAVHSPVQLHTALRRHSVGEPLRLGLWRDGESWDLVLGHTSELPA
jgi:hypothetical protein